MNSLNILSALGSTPSPPSRSSSQSKKERTESDIQESSESKDASTTQENADSSDTQVLGTGNNEASTSNRRTTEEELTEKTALLNQTHVETFDGDPKVQKSRWSTIPKGVAAAFVGGIRVIISTLAAPGYYIIACFYDQDGRFSVAMPFRRIGKLFRRKKRKSRPLTPLVPPELDEKFHGAELRVPKQSRKPTPSISTATSRSSSTEPDFDTDVPTTPDDTPSRNTRSRNDRPARRDGKSKKGERSTRTRPQRGENEKGKEPKKTRKKRAASNAQPAGESSAVEEAALLLKSPTSPASKQKVTHYPKPPAAPRPLIPRRQPSYIFGNPLGHSPSKTLVIDLDETLIHSMARGGRMSTGQMVEVKLQHPVGVGGVTIGPQVPILYYVHKRPHCDEFLRKMSKWYKLVIFTASVQEYADPVIDWLEQERQFFSGRYYRQHCTFRNGAYIKDLSRVEPDLSKVMILDNSPMSYIFHQDNAIPIEGWISDPTDNDLLHLIPMLEALQYVMDVRALLALRLGEPKVA